MSWEVLHVRPRCEKKLAEYCLKLCADYYLPLRSETKVYQRRKVTVDKPVFPGYLFINPTPDQRLALLKTNQVVRSIAPDDETRFLHELDQVRQALAVDPTLAAADAIHRGTWVRITGGPFLGIEGIVADIRNRSRVRLNVEMIGRAVEVIVAREYLETIA